MAASIHLTARSGILDANVMPLTNSRTYDDINVRWQVWLWQKSVRSSF